MDDADRKEIRGPRWTTAERRGRRREIDAAGAYIFYNFKRHPTKY
jgi:hypothetical protein